MSWAQAMNIANEIRHPGCWVLAIFLVLASHDVTWAHDSDVDWPTAEELRQVQPAIAGAIPVARRVANQWGRSLDATQRQNLEELNHHLEVMRMVDAGLMGAERYQTALQKVQLVDYYRWRAEVSLQRLMDSLNHEQLLTLDLRAGASPARDPVEVNVSGQSPLVPLRIICGPHQQATHQIGYRWQKWDLIQEYDDRPFTLVVNPSGTTYLFLQLENLPPQETIAHVSIQTDQDTSVVATLGLTLHTQRHGQLAIDVVDESGQSVPVLMSITAAETGQMWEPAEAVDLTGLLNDIVPHLGMSGRGYMFYLFGERRGRYWIVQPPLEMPLPPGEWEIKVLRGLEFTPICETVSVKSEEWTRMHLKPKRWTNMAERGWYSGDDHVHARLQTSEDARKLLTYVQAVDINVANILEMGDSMRTYYAQRGFGKDFRSQRGDHWLVPGQEDPRSLLGHAIGLNLQTKVRDLDRYLSNDWIATEIHRQGGLYGHTHVGPNACFVHREMALFTPDDIVDFNSIMQATLGTELYYDFLNLGFKMTASAGADTPYGGTIGAVRTYAYTGNLQSFSPDRWFQAVRNGQTFVTNGPMVELTVDGRMPGSEVVVNEPRKVVVRARAWGDSQGTKPAVLNLVQLGKVVHQVNAGQQEGSVLEATVERDSEYGFWIAAHVIADDGSQAHTTPVYVKREGFRHWNVQQANELLEKQMETLDEIEQEVQKSERHVLLDGLRLDVANRRVAEQAEAIRAKVAQVRQFYDGLRNKLRQELIQRHVETGGR